MSTGLTAIAVILMLAFFVESTTEYVFGEFLDKKVIKYVALAAGVAVALVFNVTMLSSLAGLTVNPYADMVLSGMVMGRGSSYVHDFYSKYLAKPSPPPS